MGLLSKLFGRAEETDDQREIRQYNEQNAGFTAEPVNSQHFTDSGKAVFVVEDVFTISGRGTVVTGTVTEGCFNVGDNVTIDSDVKIPAVITGIEQFRKMLDTAHAGDNAGLLLSSNITRNQIHHGDLITK